MITTRACDGKFDINSSLVLAKFLPVKKGAIKRRKQALLIDEFD